MGNFDLKLSGLRLHIDLLHEMQLIKFFDSLRTNIKGWFIIDHCSLERAVSTKGSEVTSQLSGTAQLKAECVGGWITMKKKGTL
jgi:hypothetical protein